MDFPPTYIEFGPFELDLARGELRENGEPVELPAKPLSLLVHLAVHRDRVVPKQELFDELWPDVVVGEAALSSAIKDLRRALGDDGSQMQFVRTFRRRGYRFVADITPTEAGIPQSETQASPSPGSPPGMVLRDRDNQPAWYRPRAVDLPKIRAPFAGRADELRVLTDALRSAESGHPHFQLLEGDAGSGKTRLVEEFVERECRYVDVAIGRARSDSARPYLAVAEALSGWISDRDVRLEELVHQESQTLTRLLHPAQLGDQDESRSRLLGERERSELFAGLSNTVIALAQRQPAVLILEDLQWADVSTLNLLDHLSLAVGEAAEHAPVPLLIVATVQPQTNSENYNAIERILLDEHCHRLRLTDLHEPAIAEIMDSMGFENPPANWVSSVSELSGGNPLFAQEIVRRLRDSGESGLALPANLELALGQRLSELSPDCQEVLTIAALIGDSFGLLALAAACDRSEQETRKLIEVAAEAGIVTGTRRAFRFEQRSWSHILKSELDPERRRTLHARLADVLEDLYASAGGEHAIEIANHLVEASDPEDGDRLLTYGRLAGEQSLAMYAWREAGRFFAAAAEVQQRIAEADRAGLHLRAGIAFNHDWDAASCIHHYEHAAAGFRRCNDHAGVAWALMYMTRARMTLGSSAYGDDIDVAELEATADILQESAPALRALLLELLSEVAWMSGGSARSRKLAEEALVIGHNLEDDEVSHHACMGLALAQFQSLRVREALESWRAAHRHARALDANWLAAPAATRDAMALQHLGRFAEAEQTLDEALATARRAHNLGELSFGSAQRAGLRAAWGDTDGALKAAVESINMMSRSRYPWGGPYALLARMIAHVLRGEHELARDGIRELVAPGVVFDEPGPAMQLLVAVSELWIDAATRQPLDSERLTNLALLVAAAGQDAYILGPAAALVDIAERNGRIDLVVSLEPLLRLAHDRSIRFSTGWVLSIERVLASIVREQGDAEGARQLLESALETATAAGALPEAVQIRLMIAHSNSDVESQSAEATAHRTRALEIAKQLDSPQLVEECTRRGAREPHSSN